MLEQFTLDAEKFDKVVDEDMRLRCPSLIKCSSACYGQWQYEQDLKDLTEVRELEREDALTTAMRTVMHEAIETRTSTSRSSDHLHSIVSIP